MLSMEKRQLRKILSEKPLINIEEPDDDSKDED